MLTRGESVQRILRTKSSRKSSNNNAQTVCGDSKLDSLQKDDFWKTSVVIWDAWKTVLGEAN